MLKSILLLFTGLSITFTFYAQSNLSKYEKRWALIYPITSLKVKKHLKETYKIYDDVKTSNLLDTLESGGKLDAFRHSFTMAYLVRFISVKKLRLLGIAHEKGNKLSFYKNNLEFGDRPDSLTCVMDLRNNELGFLIGKENKRRSINELKAIMINEIVIGNAWYLLRNSKHEYTQCNGIPIVVNDFKKQWFIPKCLIKTNQ